MMDFSKDDAVTPVVGTVMILLITMAGMGAVLAWGVPAVQGIQDQSTLSSMQGEFSDLRLNTLILKIVDSSRLRSVALSDGQLDLEPGSRFAIQVVHNDTFPGSGTSKDCDFRVTGWTTPGDSVVIDESNCGTGLDETAGSNKLGVQVDELVGSSVQSRPAVTVSSSNPYTVATNKAGDDLSEGNWRIRFVDGDGDVVAQTFIFSTDRIAWHLETSVNDMDLYVEGGAIFHVDTPEVFNLASAQISEDVFGTGDYLLELPTYSGPDVAFAAPADPEVFLQLQGSHGRVTGQESERLRYNIAGDLAEAWCNHIVFRTESISAGTYAEDSGDGDDDCATGDAEGVRSVLYEPTAETFPFEFIQKRVYASISA